MAIREKDCERIVVHQVLFSYNAKNDIAFQQMVQERHRERERGFTIDWGGRGMVVGYHFLCTARQQMRTYRVCEHALSLSAVTEYSGICLYIPTQYTRMYIIRMFPHAEICENIWIESSHTLHNLLHDVCLLKRQIFVLGRI